MKRAHLDKDWDKHGTYIGGGGYIGIMANRMETTIIYWGYNGTVHYVNAR